MEIVGWIILAVIVVIFVIGLSRKVNENYTFGSGMFKNSDANLEKDDHVDPSDYNYYDKKGKFK